MPKQPQPMLKSPRTSHTTAPISPQSKWNIPPPPPQENPPKANQGPMTLKIVILGGIWQIEKTMKTSFIPKAISSLPLICSKLKTSLGNMYIWREGEREISFQSEHRFKWEREIWGKLGRWICWWCKLHKLWMEKKLLVNLVNFMASYGSLWGFQAHFHIWWDVRLQEQFSPNPCIPTEELFLYKISHTLVCDICY